MTDTTTATDQWVYLGLCGVDSGQLLICDPCYVDKGIDYEGVCRVVAEGGGQIDADYPKGVVFSSGKGDGCYDVVGKLDDSGTLVEVRILLTNPSESGIALGVLGIDV